MTEQTRISAANIACIALSSMLYFIAIISMPLRTDELSGPIASESYGYHMKIRD